MKKFFQGLMLGTLIGVGGMWFVSGDYRDVTIEPLPAISYEESRDSYVVPMDEGKLSDLLEDSKAAPCYCVHNETRQGAWCEHEDYICEESTAKTCEKQFKNHTCFAGIAVNMRVKK